MPKIQVFLAVSLLSLASSFETQTAGNSNPDQDKYDPDTVDLLQSKVTTYKELALSNGTKDLATSGAQALVVANTSLLFQDRRARFVQIITLLNLITITAQTVHSCNAVADLNQEIADTEEAIELVKEEKSLLEDEMSILEDELHSMENSCTFSTYWTEATPPDGGGPCLSSSDLQRVGDPAEDAISAHDDSNPCLADGDVLSSSIEVTGCSDSSWNGVYQLTSSTTDGAAHWQMDSSHEIYRYSSTISGEWRIANYAAGVYSYGLDGFNAILPVGLNFEHGCTVSGASSSDACCDGLDSVWQGTGAQVAQVCGTPGEKCGRDSFSLVDKDLDTCLVEMGEESSRPCPSKIVSWEPDGPCTCCADESESAAAYMYGNLGEKACPTSYTSISDQATCQFASDYLGITYDSTRDDGTTSAVCNAWSCGDGTCDGVRLSSNHGSSAKWICQQVPYYMMDLGSCCCPLADRITTIEDCREAHDALGLIREGEEWTGNYDQIPGGCSTRQSQSKYLHFNSHEPGNSRSSLAPICKRAIHANVNFESALEFDNAHTEMSVYATYAHDTPASSLDDCKALCENSECGSISWNSIEQKCMLNKGPCDHRLESTLSETNSNWDTHLDMNKDMDSRILGPGHCYEQPTSETTVTSHDACKALCVADTDCMYYSYKATESENEFTCRLYSKQTGCTLDCNCKVKLYDNIDRTGASFATVDQDIWVTLTENRKNQASLMEISGYGCMVSTANGDAGDAGDPPGLFGQFMATPPWPAVYDANSDYFQEHEDTINSVLLTCLRTVDDTWVTVVVTRPCSADAESVIQGKRDQVTTKGEELMELESKMKALEAAMAAQENALEAQFCNTLIGVLEKLKSFMCEIVQCSIWALSKVLDYGIKKLPGIGTTLTAMGMKPMCLPKSMGKKTSYALKVTKGALSWMYVKIMCLMPEIGQAFIDECPPIADTYEHDAKICLPTTVVGMMVSLVMNIACGNIVSAIQTIASPAIMCRLALKDDGGMCQTENCIFGPFDTSFAQRRKAEILHILSNGTHSSIS